MAKSDHHDLLKQYQRFAQRFLKQYYGLSLTVPLKINGRLKRTFGRFIHDTQGRPCSIELSRTFVCEHPEHEVLDVLRHELIHYALFTLGKPHTDSSPIFQAELRKHGVSKTRTYPYRGLGHRYRCTKCQRQIFRIRRISRLHRKVCATCRGKISYEGVVYLPGN